MNDNDAPADLLTRLDALRTYLRNNRHATEGMGDKILMRHAQGIIDRHLATVDDACERLQF